MIKEATKKIISFFVILIIMINLFPPSITLADGETTNGETEEVSTNFKIKNKEEWDISKNEDGSVIARWTLNNKTLTISGTGQMKDWGYINSKEEFQKYSSILENVVIEEGVTTIGKYAFYMCKKLKSIQIPEGVITIESNAFTNCVSLTNITLPEGLIAIGDNAFNRCKSLESITIPNSVVYIYSYAFSNCSSLKNINVKENNVLYSSLDGVLYSKDLNTILQYPEGKEETSYSINSNVTKIAQRAFYNCSSLKNIEIPSNVTSIGNGAFSNCGLTSITLPEGVTSIESDAFKNCGNLTNITLPNSLTSIGTSAFEGCFKLTSLTIPEGVTSIGSMSFPKSLFIICKTNSKAHQCAEQSEILYKLTDNATSQFSTTYKIRESVEIDISQNGDNSVKAKWTLSDKTIRFSGTGKMKDAPLAKLYESAIAEKVIIGSGITNIGNYAFSTKRKINSVSIPSSVTEIGNYAFNECENLTSLTIPNGVTKIGSYAFGECKNLSTISISESVNSIGVWCFEGCPNITSFSVNSNNRYYSSVDGVLYGKEYAGILSTSLKTVVRYPAKKSGTSYTINSTVESILGNAFEDCKNLKSITIPNGVEYIESKAFKNSSLTSINIPNSVRSVGSSIFENCTKLESVTLSSNITTVESYMFRYCEKLKNITIPNNVTQIGRDAFSDCYNLAGLIIPETVTTIDDENYSLAQFVKCNENGEVQKKLESLKVLYQVIDITPPVLEIEYSNIEMTNQNVTVAITANEEVQELSGWTISADEKTLTKTYSANKTENITVLDLAGNSSNIQVKITNIDKTAPTLDVRYSTLQLTNNNVTVTITADEAVKGISDWILSTDKKTMTKVYKENKTENLTVLDLAGNSTTIEVAVTNIDKTGPSLNVSYSTTERTKENVVVTLTADEQVQEVSGWTLSTNKKKLTKTYSENISETINVLDLVGNKSTTTINIENIITAWIESDTYEIGDNSIKGVEPNSTVSEVKNNLEIEAESIVIYNTKGNVLQEGDKITTGSRIVLDSEYIYTFVVTGDVDGDASIGIQDLIGVNKHRLEKKLLSGIYFEAGDINQDGDINVFDLLLINKVRLGKVSL